MGVDPPVSKVRTTASGEEIPACYNSGVLTVPGEFCEQLEREWGGVHAAVLDALGEGSEVMPKHLHFFADQISLAIWAAETSSRSKPCQ